ncbi:hypothetical protein SDC9_78205 [bioreactor metagenome]|uniref:Uncharacterized protein n=1 Tax=bioreactor metagenome TaxID=1076179 RepID=A0A644YTK2_9ZZZZ
MPGQNFRRRRRDFIRRLTENPREAKGVDGKLAGHIFRRAFGQNLPIFRRFARKPFAQLCLEVGNELELQHDSLVLSELFQISLEHGHMPVGNDPVGAERRGQQRAAAGRQRDPGVLASGQFNPDGAPGRGQEMEAPGEIAGMIGKGFDQPQTVDPEAVAVDQRNLAVEIGFADDRRNPRHHPVGESDRADALLDMELARLAVLSDPAPVADPEGGVAVLLDFEDQIARADGVNRPRLNEIAVADLRRKTLEQLRHPGRIELLDQQVARGARRQPGENFAVRFAADDIPHFGLGFGAVAVGAAVGFVGMDLKRQPFAGIDQFDQQREARAIPVGAEQRLPVMPDQCAELAAGQRTVGHLALSVAAVGKLPRFADRVFVGDGGRQFAAEHTRQQRSAPYAALVNRLEHQRVKRTGFG